MQSEPRRQKANGDPDPTSVTRHPARCTKGSQRTSGLAAGASPSEVSKKITKQAQIIAMLQRDQGTSITAIAGAVGWQRHSVRGFFAAVLKKRFGYDLISRRTPGGERLYRIDLLAARRIQLVDDETE